MLRASQTHTWCQPHCVSGATAWERSPAPCSPFCPVSGELPSRKRGTLTPKALSPGLWGKGDPGWGPSGRPSQPGPLEPSKFIPPATWPGLSPPRTG